MYEFEWSPDAAAALNPAVMPLETALAVAQVLGWACADPWNYQRRPDEPLDRHHAHRWVMTADGHAKVWFQVRDGEGLLYVTRIELLG